MPEFTPISGTSPLISCLMVTLPVHGRLAFAKRSISAYCSQTFRNRELVVVVDQGEIPAREELMKFVRSLGRNDIRVHLTQQQLTLGAMRNLSLDAAQGEVVCQWDDDDLHHPQRLEIQWSMLAGGDFEAVYIQDVMQYFPMVSRMFLTNWRATEAGGHPGTLMMLKDAPVRYPESGEAASLAEDLAVSLQLKARGRVVYCRDAPHLFVYVSHGANTWNDSHHAMLAKELSVSRALLLRREGAIRGGLEPFGFPGNSIDVWGSNGVAFRI